MQRRTIALIWLAGLLVAALAYAADPNALVNAALDLVAAGIAAVERVVSALSVFSAAMVRALAVGLFVTFIGLSLLAIRQGRKGWAALVGVSVGFMLLVHGGASNENWVTAFALAAIAALVMTGRVRRGPP